MAGRLSHPYVVRTYGACTEDASELILVMEVTHTLPRDRALSFPSRFHAFICKQQTQSLFLSLPLCLSLSLYHAQPPPPPPLLQYAEGGTLRDLIKARSGTLPDHERMQFVQQLAAGLSYLHSHEVRLPNPSALNTHGDAYPCLAVRDRRRAAHPRIERGTLFVSLVFPFSCTLL